jgi:hypothetical protein
MRTRRNARWMISLMQVSLVLGPWTTLTGGCAPVQAAEGEWRVSGGEARSIGSAESDGEMRIDGRLVLGRQILHEGGVIRAGKDQTHLKVPGIGEIVLTEESELGLDRVRLRAESGTLLGSLREGSVSFRLDSQATALIRTGRQSFLAGPGAVFRLRVISSTDELEVAHGNVESIGNWSVDLSVISRPPAPAREKESDPPSGSERFRPAIPASTGSVADIQYQIKPLLNTGQLRLRALTEQALKFQVTDGEDRPVSAGMAVSFFLDKNADPHTGSLGKGRMLARKLTVLTDERGVATVPFWAGTRPGTLMLHAAVLSSDLGGEAAGTQIHPLVIARDGFWTKKKAIPVLATVGAIAAIAIYVISSREESYPIQVSGSALIVP